MTDNASGAGAGAGAALGISILMYKYIGPNLDLAQLQKSLNTAQREINPTPINTGMVKKSDFLAN